MEKGLDMYNDMTKTVMKFKNILLMSLIIYIPASQTIAMYISILSYFELFLLFYLLLRTF